MAQRTSRLPLASAVYLVTALAALTHLSAASHDPLLPYEPIQYLRAQLPSAVSSPFTKLLSEASPTDAADFITNVKSLLKTYLGKSGTSVVIAKGEKVLVQHRAKGMKWDSRIELASSNTMPLVSVVLPILLENYKSDLISNPIGQVLKGSDLSNPLVSGQESNSFLDILNKLPRTTGKRFDLDSPASLPGLTANGDLALHFVNSVLETTAKEAWMDALMALGSSSVGMSESGHLLVDLSSLLQFSLTVMHDLKMLGSAPRKEKLPLDDDKYLFGWWFNCPRSSDSATPVTANCLLPSAPTDTIFTLSKDLRMYISPSLELTVIVTGPGANPTKKGSEFATGKKLESIADILVEDEELMKLFHSSLTTAETTSHSDIPNPPDSDSMGENVVVDKTDAQEVGEDQEAPVEDIDNAYLIELIHRSWPVINFLFWVTASHVWVYWFLHGFWFLMTALSKRAHIPRPKTAADSN